MSYTLFTWPGIVLFRMSLQKDTFESKNYKRIWREAWWKVWGCEHRVTHWPVPDIPVQNTQLYPWTDQRFLEHHFPRHHPLPSFLWHSSRFHTCYCSEFSCSCFSPSLTLGPTYTCHHADINSVQTCEWVNKWIKYNCLCLQITWMST